MRLLTDKDLPDPVVIARATNVLEKSGVVVYPTETFYGLAASAFDRDACRRVFELKGRPSVRALPLILSDREQLADVAPAISDSGMRLAERFWPGPLTLVVPALGALAAQAENGTVAVRVSSCGLARAIAASAGPVTSTSANPSGATPPRTADEVDTTLAGLVDVLIDGGATRGGAPSTIVDVTGPRVILVREGAIAFRDVLEFAEKGPAS